jgi:hypothetical protein
VGRAVLGLRLERGLSETFGQGQNFGVVETSSVSGSAAYKFTPLLSRLITGGYRANKFTGEGGGQAGRNADTNTPSSDPLASNVENRVRAALNTSFVLSRSVEPLRPPLGPRKLSGKFPSGTQRVRANFV